MSGIITQNVLDSSGLIKAVAAGGTWVEIKSLTASADATLSFVNGAADVVLDSTYPVYCFKFTNMHPATDDVEFMFNGSDDTSSHSYDITKTTNYFYAANFEGAGTPTVAYEAGRDLAQSTGFKELAGLIGNAADECASGYLYLFAPSGTTFIKQFVSESSALRYNERLHVVYAGGYFNTTAAITAIQFKMSSGNTDLGTVKLFGIKDSS
jgi:hypothetical protein